MAENRLIHKNPIGKIRRKRVKVGNRLAFLAVAVFSLTTGLSANRTYADESGSNPFAGAKIEVLGYVDYSNGKKGITNDQTTSYNEFVLKRGYFTFKKAGPDWLGVRVTMDIHQDDTGDYKVREKYLYAELKAGGIAPFTEMQSEIGLGHIPWLDFEEHINPYRCQGTMAIERAGVFNSADLGVSLRGNFGGKLADAKARTGNDHYSGRYGSWHIGVYNGGGYHASENNENKVMEGRLTARPLPDILPGLQISYLGLFGKGNAASEPDYNVNLGMVSFEHPRLVLTGQYFATTGNAKGNWIDPAGASLKTAGYSVFGEFAPAGAYGLGFFGRYDYFDADKDNLIADKTAYNMIIAGLSYDLHKGNLILASFESTSYEDDSGGKGNIPVAGNNLGDDSKFQMVYQIKF
jgi:hypothetical protein